MTLKLREMLLTLSGDFFLVHAINGRLPLPLRRLSERVGTAIDQLLCGEFEYRDGEEQPA